MAQRSHLSEKPPTSSGDSPADDSTADGSPAADARGLRPYDFSEHDPIRRQRIELLKHLHDSFAARLAETLSSHLRAGAFVSLVRIEELGAAEFLATLPSPGCVQVLEVDAVPARVLLSISPPIAFSIIDRLLGGSGSGDLVPRRALTQIEQGLLSQVTGRAADLLADAWSGVLPARLSLAQIESDPKLLRLPGEEQTITAIAFQATLGNRAGLIVLGLPGALVQALMTAAEALGSFARVRRGERDENARAMLSNLLGAAVELRTVLAHTTLKESDVASLQIGDVITTDHPAAGEVGVQVQGKATFRGEAGQLGGHTAVRITELVDEEDAAAAQSPAPPARPARLSEDQLEAAPGEVG
jgi:flagellar motor switch protein FliM